MGYVCKQKKTKTSSTDFRKKMAFSLYFEKKENKISALLRGLKLKHTHTKKPKQIPHQFSCMLVFDFV